MRLPRDRGPLSAAVLGALAGTHELADGHLVEQAEHSDGRLTDEDLQLTLWVLYELHYRGFEGLADDWEWHPGLLAVRRALEDRLLHRLRRDTEPWVQEAVAGTGDVATRLFALTEAGPAAPLSAHLQREATREQFLEYLVHKSVYHLKESDPQSFVLPRLSGGAKVALAELQYDEYGAGRPDRLHQTLFAQALLGCGLEPEYGAYLDQVPAATLAVTNVMNLFALHRSLAPTAMGHLGAFEATSSEPCRRVAGGCRRLGLPDSITAYYEEHVEADAVHEQLAFRDICGAMAAEDPRTEEALFFGAAAYLHSEATAGQAVLDAWAAGRSSLRESPGSRAERSVDDDVEVAS